MLDVTAHEVTKTDASLIYFSSKTENTHKLATKLQASSQRLPIRANELPVRATRPFVLMTPCFADAHGNGAVPKPVIRFLNDPHNRKFLRGVIASGNRNFGETFALAGKIIAQKCDVPVLYRFELAGTETDVTNIENGLGRFLAAA
tara:strand:- start:614 stop:1051 length:438 start_codon:yes stop_codon:yes gene_type:complete